MKPITINVSEPVYEEFQRHAKKVDRTAAELIRESMELYRRERMGHQTSLRQRVPASVGGSILPIGADDDILGEMLDGARG